MNIKKYLYGADGKVRLCDCWNPVKPEQREC